MVIYIEQNDKKHNDKDSDIKPHIRGKEKQEEASVSSKLMLPVLDDIIV